MTRASRCLDALAALMFVATVLRMAVVVLHSPITGYANNLDFFRQSACVGLWESYSGVGRIVDHLAGPVNDLVFDGQTNPDFCLPSSDNIFPWMAAHAHGLNAHVPLREVGAIKLVATIGLMVFVLLQPMSAAFRVTVALAFLLVFGDIAMLTYFNTLYVDASGIVCATGMVALMAVTWARRRAPGWVFCAVVMGFDLWLGATKPQYAPLAGLLGLASAACMMGRWRDKWKALALLVTALAAVTLPQLAGGKHRVITTINHINMTDTVLWAVLPFATDQAAALRTIGLPPSCAPAIVSNIYGSTGPRADLCPEVDHVHRTSLIPLFLSQPATFLAPVMIGIAASRPAYLGFAHFERPDDANGWRFRWLRATSLSEWVMSLSLQEYRLLVLAACAFGSVMPVAVAAALVRQTVRRRNLVGLRRTPHGMDQLVPVMILFSGSGILCVHALLSSVFGDGFAEVARHAACLVVGLGLCFAALTGGVLICLLNGRSTPP